MDPTACLHACISYTHLRGPGIGLLQSTALHLGGQLAELGVDAGAGGVEEPCGGTEAPSGVQHGRLQACVKMMQGTGHAQA